MPYPPQLLQHRAERVGLLWEIKSLSTGRIRNLLPTIRMVDQGETDGEGVGNRNNICTLHRALGFLFFPLNLEVESYITPGFAPRGWDFSFEVVPN